MEYWIEQTQDFMEALKHWEKEFSKSSPNTIYSDIFINPEEIMRRMESSSWTSLEELWDSTCKFEFKISKLFISVYMIESFFCIFDLFNQLQI